LSESRSRRTGFDSRQGQDFSLLHSVQTSLRRTHPLGARGVFPGVKRPGREADHSPPSNAEVKNGGAIPPLSHMPSWHSAN
jgi:hypothetical protein